MRRFVTVPVPAKDTVLGELTSRHVDAAVLVKVEPVGTAYFVSVSATGLPPVAAQDAASRLEQFCNDAASWFDGETWRFEADVPSYAMTDRVFRLMQALRPCAPEAWLDIQHGIANVCFPGDELTLEEARMRLEMAGEPWVPYLEEPGSDAEPLLATQPF